MSYRKDSAVTKTVFLFTEKPNGSPYSAVVRALRAPEEDEVQAALLGGRKQKASAQSGSGQTITNIALEMDAPAQIEKTLLLGTVSWDLVGDPTEDDPKDLGADGVLLVNAVNLAKLTGGDRNTLYVAINDLTSGPSAVQKKDSASDSVSS